MKSLLSGLLHFFEVHVFTLVFGEDLFLLPSGVGFRGTATGVLASSVLLFACIKIGSRLLVGTVGHVKAIREANSEERQDEIQNASESNAKEDNKSYHKGEKTSERGVHTVEVWGDGSKKEAPKRRSGGACRNPVLYVECLGVSPYERRCRLDCCAQKTAIVVGIWKECNKRANVVD